MSEVAFNVEQGEDYYIHVTRFSQYTSGDEFLLSVECVDCTAVPPSTTTVPPHSSCRMACRTSVRSVARAPTTWT